jgi:hypothetical protein
LLARYGKIWSIFEKARTFGWILSDENPRKVPPKIFKPPLRKFDRSYFSSFYNILMCGCKVAKTS